MKVTGKDHTGKSINPEEAQQMAQKCRELIGINIRCDGYFLIANQGKTDIAVGWDKDQLHIAGDVTGETEFRDESKAMNMTGDFELQFHRHIYRKYIISIESERHKLEGVTKENPHSSVIKRTVGGPFSLQFNDYQEATAIRELLRSVILGAPIFNKMTPDNTRTEQLTRITCIDPAYNYDFKYSANNDNTRPE